MMMMVLIKIEEWKGIVLRVHLITLKRKFMKI